MQDGQLAGAADGSSWKPPQQLLSLLAANGGPGARAAARPAQSSPVHWQEVQFVRHPLQQAPSSITTASLPGWQPAGGLADGGSRGQGQGQAAAAAAVAPQQQQGSALASKVAGLVSELEQAGAAAERVTQLEAELAAEQRRSTAFLGLLRTIATQVVAIGPRASVHAPGRQEQQQQQEEEEHLYQQLQQQPAAAGAGDADDDLAAARRQLAAERRLRAEEALRHARELSAVRLAGQGLDAAAVDAARRWAGREAELQAELSGLREFRRSVAAQCVAMTLPPPPTHPQLPPPQAQQKAQAQQAAGWAAAAGAAAAAAAPSTAAGTTLPEGGAPQPAAQGGERA